MKDRTKEIIRRFDGAGVYMGDAIQAADDILFLLSFETLLDAYVYEAQLDKKECRERHEAEIESITKERDAARAEADALRLAHG